MRAGGTHTWETRSGTQATSVSPRRFLAGLLAGVWMTSMAILGSHTGASHRNVAVIDGEWFAGSSLEFGCMDGGDCLSEIASCACLRE